VICRRLLALAMCAVAVPACGPATTSARQVGATAPSDLPVAPPTRKVVLDPLTGLTVSSLRPVVVIKVDNAGTARRYQRGLGRADLVYQELVESGETRFAAVFTDGSSAEVGPVRSVRESDIELLRQYGPIHVTGGHCRLAAGREGARHRAALRLPRLLGWHRSGQRPRVVLRRSRGHRHLRRGNRPLGGGPERADSAGGGPGQRGRAGGPDPHEPLRRRARQPDALHGERRQRRRDVLRDGRAVRATWRRPSATRGTRFVDGAGKDVPLRPGPTWVLLLPKGRPLTLG
jgi:hypothetical protein